MRAPRTARRRWGVARAAQPPRIAVGLLLPVVGVVLLVSAAFLAPSAWAPSHVAPLSPALVPRIEVALGNWSGGFVELQPSCDRCSQPVVAGSLLELAVRATPQCGLYGCPARLISLDVSVPSILLSVTPALPTNLSPAGMTFNLSIRLPDLTGSILINGTGSADAPPLPVDVLAQHWSVVNETGTSGGVAIEPLPSSVTLAPGGAWNETLYLNNSSPEHQRMTALSVSAPFGLVSALPGFPIEMDPNESAQLRIELKAPSVSGSFDLNGSGTLERQPLVYIDQIFINFTDGPAVFTVAGVDVPLVVLPGEESRGSVLLYNPTNVTHAFAFNHTSGPFFFLNCTPNGTTAVAAGATSRFYLTVSPINGPGRYDLGIWFRVVY